MQPDDNHILKEELGRYLAHKDAAFNYALFKAGRVDDLLVLRGHNTVTCIRLCAPIAGQSSAVLSARDHNTPRGRQRAKQDALFRQATETRCDHLVPGARLQRTWTREFSFISFTLQHSQDAMFVFDARPLVERFIVLLEGNATPQRVRSVDHISNEIVYAYREYARDNHVGVPLTAADEFCKILGEEKIEPTNLLIKQALVEGPPQWWKP